VKDENSGLAPWQWPEERWRGVVAFDSDHETTELRDAGESAGRLSQGQYGNRRAMPRILDILGSHDVKASFFVPAVTALLYPDEQR